jgi:hypothetical protein
MGFPLTAASFREETFSIESRAELNLSTFWPSFSYYFFTGAVTGAATVKVGRVDGGFGFAAGRGAFATGFSAPVVGWLDIGGAAFTAGTGAGSVLLLLANWGGVEDAVVAAGLGTGLGAIPVAWFNGGGIPEAGLGAWALATGFAGVAAGDAVGAAEEELAQRR